LFSAVRDPASADLRMQLAIRKRPARAAYPNPKRSRPGRRCGRSHNENLPRAEASMSGQKKTVMQLS
jgi:hypothetical protein